MNHRPGARPSVSVLLPAYNAAGTLGTAIGSVLRQAVAGGEMELVVVNDGSTDNTADVLEACARRDSRVRIVDRPNGGIVAALNDGWRVCSGVYVVRMDADDISLPWRIERQVAFMERHPEVVASGTGLLPFQSQPPFLGLPARFPGDEAGIATRLLFNPPIMHPTAILRRSALNPQALYSPDMPQAEDYELWTRLAGSHRLGNIGDLCLLYRRSATSISSARRSDQISQACELRQRNLARLLGAGFAAEHGEAHAELMLRRYAPTALVEHLPDYLRLLLGQPAVSAPVIAKVWFSYCLGWSRAGGDGARLFRRLDTGHGALLRHVISLQELLR